VSALVWKGNIDDNGTVAEVDEDGEVMIRYGLWVLLNFDPPVRPGTYRKGDS